MISQRPSPPEQSSNEAAVARDSTALLMCAQTCERCADACIRDADHALSQCIRLALDCADVCGAAAALLARELGTNDEVLLRLLDACATATQHCADECERHAAQVSACAQCAQTCRRCEEQCRLTMQLIGGASGLVQTN